MADLLQLDAAARGLPHLAQYFGVWAMHEPHFRGGLATLRNLNLAAHIEVHAGQGTEPAAQFETVSRAGSNIAVISLEGTLMKRAASFTQSTSTVRARRDVRMAANDRAVDAIVLLIDSPGGTVAGTKDLADEVARAAKQKQVVAYIEDLGASAAYWIASQAHEVYSNQTALVGSIGTLMVVQDLSKMAESEGVTVHVISTGPYKGAGTPGSEITDEQLAYFQETVNQLNEQFLAGVKGGRKMTAAKVREIADGRVHVADRALTLGLVDGIRSFDQVLDSLAKSSKAANPSKPRSDTVSDTQQNDAPATAKPQPATAADLKAALPGADPKFILDQLEGNATLEQAKDAYIKEQHQQLQAAQQAKQEAEEKAAAATPPKKPGVQAVTGSGPSAPETSADPIAEWDRQVAELMAGGKSRRDAIAQIAKQDPDLHASYLEAYNTRHASVRKERAQAGSR